MLLVRFSSTFRNGDFFVDSFVEARLFEFGSCKQQHNHAWGPNLQWCSVTHIVFKAVLSLEVFVTIVRIHEGEIKICRPIL